MKGIWEVKAGSSSAKAFGQVLQLVRKSLGKSQMEIASSIEPKLSVSAISMAESGNRPLKTEELIRSYARALDLDDDDLVELWMACQGIVVFEDRKSERSTQGWWREIPPRLSLEGGFLQVRAVKEAAGKWTPNDEFYAPDERQFELAEAIAGIVQRLLGEDWSIQYTYSLGLSDPIDGRFAAVNLVLKFDPIKTTPSRSSVAVEEKIICPTPTVRPGGFKQNNRPTEQEMSPEVAWILNAVEKMSGKERAAVAGFIHGLREASSLFVDLSEIGDRGTPDS